jgi:hypothetical protein
MAGFKDSSRKQRAPAEGNPTPLDAYQAAQPVRNGLSAMTAEPDTGRPKRFLFDWRCDSGINPLNN